MVFHEAAGIPLDGENFMKELRTKLQQLEGRLKTLETQMDISAKRKRMAELKEASAKSDFWNDAAKAQEQMKELDQTQAIVSELDAQKKACHDAREFLDLEEEGMEDLAGDVLAQLEQVERVVEQIEFRRMLSGEHDAADAILFINAGAGGTESCDWAEMLLRMYRRWCDKKGFKNEVVDFAAGDGAGFRSATMTVMGQYAYGYLKAEIGVHRLVRISPFDSNKRRHTSFASVFVLPDVEKDIEIEVRPDDLEVDTFRSGGAGGQHVNKTESAIRITHVPSGIIVACQSQRSQHQNRALAMKLLKAKLFQKELEKRQKEREAIEKSKKKIEWGSQIRSYVLHPYRMVKDHRTDLEAGDADRVLDGDLDPFIQKFLLEFS